MFISPRRPIMSSAVWPQYVPLIRRCSITTASKSFFYKNSIAHRTQSFNDPPHFYPCENSNLSIRTVQHNSDTIQKPDSPYHGECLHCIRCFHIQSTLLLSPKVTKTHKHTQIETLNYLHSSHEANQYTPCREIWCNSRAYPNIAPLLLQIFLNLHQ